MPYRDSPNHELEIVKCFDSLNLFKPNERTEEYHLRKPNDENFLFEIEDSKFTYVGENIISFEKIDKVVKNFSELGFNDIKFPFAYSEENLYFLLYRRYITIGE